VFVGGCTLQAAEAVCHADGELPLDVLSGMAVLVDKSLLRQEARADGAARFVMLETIREYALEQLAASEELELIRQRHAAFFVTLAEAGVPHECLEIEYPNLRAALAWSRTEADRTTELRLVALDGFWRHSGYLSEAPLAADADTVRRPLGRTTAAARCGPGARTAEPGTSGATRPPLASVGEA
jgi:predicted ATPase